MAIKYPSSRKLSIGIAAGTTLFYAAVRIFIPVSLQWLWLECIAVAVFSYAFSWIVFNRILYPNLREQHKENIKEIRKLKEIEVFRREFIGDVSHELKTPIFAIEGFIETLLDGALDDTEVNKVFLQKALKNAERLSALVEDILTINQIESGEFEMHPVKFRINDLLEEVKESFEHKFHQPPRDISCNVVSNNHESSLVLADKERIEQVLRNLIDNAIKYGNPQGEINLCIETLSPEKLQIRISDDGPGIEKAHLPRLFERFYRVDKSRSRDRGGTGLGLSICKHFIEAHGEKIWVESTIGKGSSFLFSLTRTT